MTKYQLVSSAAGCLRAQRAVMQHNLALFGHYIWGDPRPDFMSPPLGLREDDAGAVGGDLGAAYGF